MHWNVLCKDKLSKTEIILSFDPFSQCLKPLHGVKPNWHIHGFRYIFIIRDILVLSCGSLYSLIVTKLLSWDIGYYISGLLCVVY